ncbi:hydroxyisourate hydrolase [Noviherbaspirillum soli]|uniref:hydroxyisourate hydrolase n=1 Tax=Noviherbaspirillum soli TaxID=1064518 RepID=UPI00188A3D74|nr:hydroxyisourate hydrolase [Noviherbaspirillum soli]
MKHICSVIAAVALSSLPALGFAAGPAAGNPLSVHVLNLQDGLPSPDVDVVLEKQNGTQWGTLSSGVTDAQGRVPALYPEGKKLETGTYRVTFKTGKWFASQKGVTFFPEIPVIFSVDGSVAHYHIPLLLSPYGYSTYRGN